VCAFGNDMSLRSLSATNAAKALGRSGTSGHRLPTIEREHFWVGGFLETDKNLVPHSDRLQFLLEAQEEDLPAQSNPSVRLVPQCNMQLIKL
jgi:hypothetical protein